MARLTYAQIRTYGGLVGQNDAVDTWQKVKMNAWLRKHYAAWPWPFLVEQIVNVPMNAGVSSLLIGAGGSGVTEQISRVFSPVYFRANGYSTRGKASVRQFVGGPAESALGNIDPSSQTGSPITFIVSPFTATDGRLGYALAPFPIPDKQYTLAMAVQYLPDDLADTDVPVYPNEMTLIQAAKVAALEYDQTNDPVFDKEAATLAAMVAADRDAYGGSPSFGDIMQLDDSVFPTDDTANPNTKFFF